MKKGINFLYDRKIDSLFAIAIYDSINKKIFIARDWPGRIPLYYYHDKEKFVFSSELKAFKAIKNLSLQIPIELEPGHYIEFDLNSNTLKKVKFYEVKNNLIKEK